MRTFSHQKMLLELMQAANNLDEARLETELSDRSLEQAEENIRRHSKKRRKLLFS